MPDRVVIEETESGYRRVAAVTVRHRGPDGSFVSEKEFEAARNSEIRGRGYGQGGYGSSGYG